jgi:hypothetical protein
MSTFHTSPESDLGHELPYTRKLGSVESPHPEQNLIEFGHQCTMNNKKNNLPSMPNIQIPRKPTRSQDTGSYQVISRFGGIASYTQTCYFTVHRNQNEAFEADAKLGQARKTEEIRN